MFQSNEISELITSQIRKLISWSKNDQYFKPQRNDSAPVLWDLFYKSVHSLSKGWQIWTHAFTLLTEKQQTKSTENLNL